MNVSQRINGHLVHHPALVTFNVSQLDPTLVSIKSFNTVALGKMLVYVFAPFLEA